MSQTKDRTISIEAAELLRGMLAQLPPKPRVHLTRREAVAEMESEIRRALTLGYNLTDIAQMYAAQGVAISESTLQTYLRELAPKSATKKSRTANPKKITSHPKLADSFQAILNQKKQDRSDIPPATNAGAVDCSRIPHAEE